MNGIDKLTSSAALGSAQPAGAAKLRDSAQQFEALLIAQMLKSVRESNGSWFGEGQDEAASAAIGMAEEYLAQALAAQGGLGLTSLVTQGIAKEDADRAEKRR